MNWSIKAKKQVFHNQYRTLEEWIVETPTGQVLPAYVHVLPDVVVVFGMTDDERVLVLRQFFVSSQDYRQTLVAGFVDGGDSDKTVREELLEETGCTAKEIIHVGSTVRGKWDTGTVHFYLARGVRQTSSQRLEPMEDITVSFVPLTQFEQMLARGEIDSLYEVACAYRVLEYLRYGR